MLREKSLKGEAWLKSRQKRAEDLLIVTALSPIVIATSALGMTAILAADRVNPIFLQERGGKEDESFNIVKLKTMPDGQRISRVGKFLRRLWIDEGPQAYNILRGHMSVVGNRPLMIGDYESMQQMLDPATYKEWREARRISKPGWTDLFGLNVYAQAADLNPETTAYQRARSDIEYAEQASSQLDHQIMVKSILTVFKPVSESFKNNS